jgi:hypothetical protein
MKPSAQNISLTYYTTSPIFLLDNKILLNLYKENKWYYCSNQSL